MERRRFLTHATLGAAAGAVARPASAQSHPSLQWRLTASWPKSLDIGFGSAELTARRVAELTEDRFQIRVFAGGEIVPPLQVLDGVQAGTVEMGHIALYQTALMVACAEANQSSLAACRTCVSGNRDYT